MLNKLNLFLGSGFGSGYLPKMPGTWGSLVGLFIAMGIMARGEYLLVWGTMLFICVGWYCSHQIMMSYPPEQKDTDPSFIVIDEIAGMLLTIFLVGWGLECLGIRSRGSNRFQMADDYVVLSICFVMFRFFDIFKPFPIRQIEYYLSLKRGYQGAGIMLDDLVAAVFAAMVTIAIIILV